MNTRKHPRTLQEAFGPYCTPYIEEPEKFVWSPVRIALTLTYAAAIITLICVL